MRLHSTSPLMQYSLARLPDAWSASGMRVSLLMYSVAFKQIMSCL
jgi:hypothetical protein